VLIRKYPRRIKSTEIIETKIRNIQFYKVFESLRRFKDEIQLTVFLLLYRNHRKKSRTLDRHFAWVYGKSSGSLAENVFSKNKTVLDISKVFDNVDYNTLYYMITAS